MNDRVADRLAARNRARETVERRRSEYERKQRAGARWNRGLFATAAILIVVSAVLFVVAIWGGDARPAYTAIVLTMVGVIAAVASVIMWLVRQW